MFDGFFGNAQGCVQVLICMVGMFAREKLSHYVPHWLYHYTFPSTMNESSGCSISLPAFDVICAPYLGHSNRYSDILVLL